MTVDGDAGGDSGRSLRYLEFVLHPEGDALHPAEERIAAHPDFTREHVLNIELLPDETVSVLYQLRGDVETARPVFETEDRDPGLQPESGRTPAPKK